MNPAPSISAKIFEIIFYFWGGKMAIGKIVQFQVVPYRADEDIDYMYALDDDGYMWRSKIVHNPFNMTEEIVQTEWERV